MGSPFTAVLSDLEANADDNAALSLRAWGELSAALLFREEVAASN